MPLSNECKLLKNAPLEFLKKYWVSPSNGFSSARLPDQTNPRLQRASDFNFMGRVNDTDSLLTISTLANKIAYTNLVKVDGQHYNLNCYSPEQLSDAQKADLLPIWYLPWRADHITKMRILSADQMPEGQINPDIFFTSALTGCSVFVKGPARIPTVFHAGFDSNRNYVAHPKVDPDSIQHWRILFNRYAPGGPFSEANKSQYLAAFRDSPDLQVYMNLLKTMHGGKLRLENIIGEGSVFGVRDKGTGDWHFYLQESVTIVCREVRVRRKFFGGTEEVVGNQQTYTRPMCVVEFFPDGSGTVRAWNTDRLLA